MKTLIRHRQLAAPATFSVLDDCSLQTPPPPSFQGVVRVHVLEARNLVAKDTYLRGLVKGKSDPYTIVRVGNQHFKTKTIDNCLDPKWNEVYEVESHMF